MAATTTHNPKRDENGKQGQAHASHRAQGCFVLASAFPFKQSPSSDQNRKPNPIVMPDDLGEDEGLCQNGRDIDACVFMDQLQLGHDEDQYKRRATDSG